MLYQLRHISTHTWKWEENGFKKKKFVLKKGMVSHQGIHCDNDNDDNNYDLYLFHKSGEPKALTTTAESKFTLMDLFDKFTQLNTQRHTLQNYSRINIHKLSQTHKLNALTLTLSAPRKLN